MTKRQRQTSRARSTAANAPDERPHVAPLLPALVLATFAVAFTALAVAAYVQKSGTWDEPMHLTAGYVALAHGDYRLDPAHPPLVRMWAALPLVTVLRPTLDTAAVDGIAGSAALEVKDEYELARRFLYVDNDADRLLHAGRFMVVLLGVLLGALLFWWAFEWLGFVPAVFALTFYTLEPNMTAHASLITTDLGVTCFIFGAVYFLWRTCRAATAGNMLGVAVLTALACVAKFSGLLLWPIIGLLLVVAVLRRSISPKSAVAVLAVAASVTFVTIWAVYGGRHAPSVSAGWAQPFTNTPLVQTNAPRLGAAAAWVDANHLLPSAFVQGFAYSQASSRQIPSFLAGESRIGGWWYYFPIAFLIKTPTALLVLFAAGLFVYVRRRRELAPGNELFVILPAAVYLAFAMASGVNIGLRHILPVYPFVLMVAAAAAKDLAGARSRVSRMALAALTIFWLVRFVDIYPHTFTFFNRLVGGPANGYKYLVDSNLDWGQHLKLLKRWMDQNGVSHVNLAYFGTADPAYYGIDCTYLPGGPTFTVPSITRPKLPGYVAISATVLGGPYLQPRWRLFYGGFVERTPVAQIGNTIRVYWIDRWPEAPDTIWNADPENHAGLADALLYAQGWTDHAILHYREYVVRRPDNPAGWTGLGLALLSVRDVEGAIPVLKTAVHLDPGRAQGRRLLAGALLDRGQPEEAAVHAEEAVALEPGDAGGHDLLGVALAMQGRMDEAAIHFEHAVQIDPAHPTANEHLQVARARR